MELAGPASASSFAWLTGEGPAAIAVVRLTGPRVREFVSRHLKSKRPIMLSPVAPGAIRRATLLTADGEVLDDVIVSAVGPNEEVGIHVHVHGSPGIVSACSELLRQSGFVERPAGRLPWAVRDVLEAECLALLPEMKSWRGVRWLLAQAVRLRSELAGLCAGPFSAEGRRRCAELAAGREVFTWFSRPLKVAVVGPPNAGKSTLINALSAQSVSIASPVPGTTRDWIDVPALARGFPVVWLDTAGLREQAHGLEAEGVGRTRAVLARADAVVVVLDAADGEGTRAFVDRERGLSPTVVVLNKQDLVGERAGQAAVLPEAWGRVSVMVSALRKTGLEDLVSRLMQMLGRHEARLELPGAFTERQARHLLSASAAREPGTYRQCLERCLGDPELPNEGLAES